ncbi:MAG: S24 family peptidase [Bacteriovoracaceae bacterium]|nr:S24 family peptidase [Bacteriovoracaceae bacterium]
MKKYNIILPKASCGSFGITEDFTEPYQSLDERFIKNQASTFFFQAAGNSMEPLIFENDILVVDRAKKVKNRQVAIVSLDGQLFCKRIYFQGNNIILKSDNHRYKEQLIHPDRDFSVWGVVISIVREMA